MSSSSLSGIFLEVAELGEDEVDDLEGLVGGGAGVDAEGAGVAVGAEVRVDGVGQAALFTDGLEEAGAHAAAEHGVEDQRGVAVVVGDGRRGHAEAELDLLEGLLVLEQDARGGERASGSGARLRRGAEARISQ